MKIHPDPQPGCERQRLRRLPGDAAGFDLDFAPGRQLQIAIGEFCEQLNDHLELYAQRRERLGQLLVRRAWSGIDIDLAQQERERSLCH